MNFFKFIVPFTSMLFVGLGPVYWYPGLSVSNLLYFKYSLFFTFLILIFFDFYKNKKFFFYKKPFIFLIFPILSIILSLFLNGEILDEYSFLLNYLLPLFYLMFIPCLSQGFQNGLLKGVLNSTYIFSLICILVPLGLIIPALQFENPHSDATITYTQLYTGFALARTGWSVGACFIAAICLAKILYLKGFLRSIEFINFIIICAAIVIPTGRGGMASLILLIILFIFLSVAVFKKIPITQILFLILGCGILLIFSEYLRLDDFLSGDLGSASNGRVDGFYLAKNDILDNLLYGVGHFNSDLTKYGMEYPEVHNVILNFIWKYGLISYLLIIPFFIWIYFLIFRRLFLNEKNIIIFLNLFLLVPTVVFTFTEPNGVFGNFFNTSLYWFVICLYLHNHLFFSKKLSQMR